MRLLRSILRESAWHMNDGSFPIQVGVKRNAKKYGTRHLHRSMHEYFLVIKGHILIRVGGKEVRVDEGDLLVVEPGEPHEIFSRSPESLYLLLMPKPVPNDKVDIGSDSE